MARSSGSTKTPDEAQNPTRDAPGDDRGVEAWELTLRTVAGLVRTFEEDMKAEDFALPQYDVLVQLVLAPERRLRMQELAEGVILSRSGLTRLIDRMEKAGLVRREPVPGDRRGAYTVLTERGASVHARLMLEHHSKIAERFSRHLTDDDLEALQRVMRKLDVVGNSRGAAPERLVDDA